MLCCFITLHPRKSYAYALVYGTLLRVLPIACCGWEFCGDCPFSVDGRLLRLRWSAAITGWRWRPARRAGVSFHSSSSLRAVVVAECSLPMGMSRSSWPCAADSRRRELQCLSADPGRRCRPAASSLTFPKRAHVAHVVHFAFAAGVSTLRNSGP